MAISASWVHGPPTPWVHHNCEWARSSQRRCPNASGSICNRAAVPVQPWWALNDRQDSETAWGEAARVWCAHLQASAKGSQGCWQNQTTQLTGARRTASTQVPATVSGVGVLIYVPYSLKSTGLSIHAVQYYPLLTNFCLLDSFGGCDSKCPHCIFPCHSSVEKKQWWCMVPASFLKSSSIGLDAVLFLLLQEVKNFTLHQVWA